MTTLLLIALITLLWGPDRALAVTRAVRCRIVAWLRPARLRAAPALAVLALWAVPAGAASGPLQYAVVDVGALFGEEAPRGEVAWFASGLRDGSVAPRGVEVRGGEAYVALSQDTRGLAFPPLDRGRIAIAWPVGEAATVAALVSRPGEGAAWAEATVADGARIPVDDARREFLRAKAFRHGELWRAGVPGGAYFRRVFEDVVATFDEADQVAWRRRFAPAGNPRARAGGDLEETFAIFSGGRAMQENLQLDVVLEEVGGATDPGTVDIATIPGVTVEEIDWGPLLEGVEPPATDALAALVPQDYLAAFFPDFDSLAAIIDQAEEVGRRARGVTLATIGNEDTRGRVERQLCLPLDAMARAMGPAVVREVAIIAGDPYLREGTDIAVLLRVANESVVQANLALRWGAAMSADPAVAEVQGAAGGMYWSGVANPRRSVHSMAAVLAGVADGDDVVVVANSTAILARVASVASGTEPSLAALDEYTFFRTGYPRADEEEDVFILLTDAAIRKWASPRWRIAQSRRMRAAAGLLDAALANSALVLDPPSEPRPLAVAWMILGNGDRLLERGGPRDTVYGSLDFLTPIAELEVAEASPAEAEAYGLFRDRYQDRWRQFFDPIAIRLGTGPVADTLDISVIPLIAGTDYRELVELTANGYLDPGAGDRHAGALLHAIFHLNPESALVQLLENNARPITGGNARVFGWVGNSLELYLDRDPALEEMMASDDPDRWVGDNYGRLPLAVRVGVRNPLSLAAFLTTARTLVESSAPGMTRWEARNHGGVEYVRVASIGGSEELAIHYLTRPDSITVSPSEAVIHRAIDRALADGEGDEASPWLGRSAALEADGTVLEALERLAGEARSRQARRAAWAPIPILNAWHRAWPGRDPVDVHRELLGVDFGGHYAWNATDRTMEHLVYGSPVTPTDAAPPALLPGIARVTAGVTFEHDGVRARARMEKATAE